MKTTDLLTKSEFELENDLKELKETLFNLRFQHAINQLENPMRIKAVKKDIARVKTVLNKLATEVQSEGGSV